MKAEIEAAWAAGFYDGEGCCKSSKSRGYGGQSYINLALSITQYHSEVLERFCKAVGVGRVYGPYDLPNGKQSWGWGASGPKAELAIAVIWPNLGTAKREQINRVRAKVTESKRDRVPAPGRNLKGQFLKSQSA